MVMEHFGIRLASRKHSPKLVREEFALPNTTPSLPKLDSLAIKGAYADETGTEYSIEWCNEYRQLCLKNFDYNMNFFQHLNNKEFNQELTTFLSANPQFKEISHLHECEDMTGYYIMILDAYNQAYIGKSNNIKKRIQQHWSKTKPFDRVLLPMYNEKSVFSIDFFRALDTTRIFVWKNSLSDGIERKLINSFSPKFLCNRIGGDIETLPDALLTLNKHEL